MSDNLAFMRILVLAGLTAVAVFGQGARGPGRNGLGGSAAGFVQNPTLDKEAPQLPADLKPGGILIFSKTVGYRDEPGIQASVAALSVIAMMKGWPYFATENGAVMNADQLSKFKLIIGNNTSGDNLTDDQKAALKVWVEKGGSFLGIHGAGGDPAGNHGHTSLADWKWYIEGLIGAQFTVHSAGVMPGDIKVEDTKHPITKGLPTTWHRAEEWYAFTESPRNKPGYHVLASADEKSYTPGPATMPGGDHPLIWTHCAGTGHVVYSALGHAGFMYSEPLMIQLLENAMAWGLAENGRACK